MVDVIEAPARIDHAAFAPDALSDVAPDAPRHDSVVASASTSVVPPPALIQPASRKAREGLPPMAWALAGLAVVFLLWGAWVTKHIASPIAQMPIASIRLEQIVSEYVQAQSHSNGTPDLVTQQTGQFMNALGDELRRIGDTGTTVLVGEAVLSGNVPDITDTVRRAVYARVPMPAPAPVGAAGPVVGGSGPLPMPGQTTGSLPTGSGQAPMAGPAAVALAPSPFGSVPSGSPLDAAIAPSVQGDPNGYPN